MNIRLFLSSILIVILSSCGIQRNRMTVSTFKTHTGTGSELIYSPISWETASLAGVTIHKSSIYLPVKLQGIEKTLFMQFDLGVPRSMLYGRTLSVLCEKYPALRNDTVSIENHLMLKHAKLSFNDSLTLLADRLCVRKNFGETNIDTTFVIIGSLGYDVLGDNNIILDFKSDRFAISKSIPNELKSRVSYISKAEVNKFPIIVPFHLGKKKIRLFYDSGAGMFPVLTGTNRLKRISIQRNIEQVDSVSAWGKMIPIYTPVETKGKAGNLTLGTISFEKVNIYGDARLNKLAYTGKYLYGITGNVLFNNKILIINRKDNTFGIVD